MAPVRLASFFMTNARLAAFGTTIFSEMTRLAQAHQAINLAQGFPDFEGPSSIIEAAVEALRGGHNQYARSMGHPQLVQAIARKQKRDYGIERNPDTEVLITSGATEAIAAALIGLLNPGDEVVTFEPFYDSYPAACAMAGATMRTCTLRFPEFALDLEALERTMSPRTRVLLLNTPHNPTGKVFSSTELESIATLCRKHDLTVVTDEVYEHLVWGEHRHVPMATLPGMDERTLTISSAGKTFSLTGWKIGWATGPERLVAAVQAAHQYLTFSTATPLQLAMARAIDEHGPRWLEQLTAEYEQRRTVLQQALEETGFRVASPQGTYFMLADFSALADEDDRHFARRLVEEAGVAAIPPSPFYAASPEEAARRVRFAFCKRLETLEAAAQRLRRWARAGG